MKTVEVGFIIVLWWCDMAEVLLFSNDERIFNLTHNIIEGKDKLTWCTYESLKKDKYPFPDVVIMYVDKEMIEKEIFRTIIRVKGKLGHKVPILILIEEGTPQDIIPILRVGAYDYLEIAKNSEKYKKKIEEIVQWSWYLGKYGLKE